MRILNKVRWFCFVGLLVLALVMLLGVFDSIGDLVIQIFSKNGDALETGVANIEYESSRFSDFYVTITLCTPIIYILLLIISSILRYGKEHRVLYGIVALIYEDLKYPYTTVNNYINSKNGLTRNKVIKFVEMSYMFLVIMAWYIGMLIQ